MKNHKKYVTISRPIKIIKKSIMSKDQSTNPTNDDTNPSEPINPADSSTPSDPSNQTEPAPATSNSPTPDSSAPSATSDPEFKILQKELQDTKQKLQEMTGVSQRALADLQNYRRRVEEEKAAFIEFANAALFTELLPAIENIKRTLDHQTKDEEWIKGATATMEQISTICEKHGLKAIPINPGDQFDHTNQEALLTAPGPKDQVLEVLENGYMLGEKVLKPARVKVGNGE